MTGACKKTGMSQHITVSGLSDLCDVSVRTIRYYIAQGLLPAPDGQGRGANYGPGHIKRLHLIRQLQAEHLPLAEIRKRLEALSPAALDTLSEAPAGEPQDVDGATAYLDRLLSPTPSLRSAVDRAVERESDSQAVEESDGSDSSSLSHHSSWHRIQLDPDLELHIRRPLSRPMNRKLNRILGFIREVLTCSDRSSHPSTKETR